MDNTPKFYFYIGKHGDNPFPTWAFEETLPKVSGMYSNLLEIRSQLGKDRHKSFVIEISADVAGFLDLFMRGEEIKKANTLIERITLKSQSFGSFTLFYVSHAEDFKKSFTVFMNQYKDDFEYRAQKLQHDMERFGAMQELSELIL